jgi:CRISPR-associated protein Cas2
LIDKHYLVIYDISDIKRLQKVAKKMEDYGKRVQKSVFEIEATPFIIEKMKHEVHYIMDTEFDSVIIFDICETDWQKREKYGPKKFDVDDNDFFYIL